MSYKIHSQKVAGRSEIEILPANNEIIRLNVRVKSFNWFKKKKGVNTR